MYYISDIDECSLGGSDCEQICINTQGSYMCSCCQGYELDINNKTCTSKGLINLYPGMLLLLLKNVSWTRPY